MGTVVIRHHDDVEGMEEIVRNIFGSSIILSTVEGSHGENILMVSGSHLTDHAICDIERMEFVLSAEFGE